MPVDKKSKSLWEPGKRFARWLICSCAFSFVALAVMWGGDHWVELPLARLIFSSVLVLGYVLIAVVVHRLYDAEGNRVRVQQVTVIESEASS